MQPGCKSSTIEIVAEDELRTLARRRGTRSVEALVLKKLSRARRKDRQFEVYRIADTYLIGPPPDGQVLRLLMAIAEGAE